MKEPFEYVKTGKHLPKFMQDFHDQKDLFKAISENYSKNEWYQENGNWVNEQIYIIDYFLWFMAQHGYTLSKSRADVNFYDIHETINENRKKRLERMSEIIFKK
jgi:hypothetical protein